MPELERIAFESRFVPIITLNDKHFDLRNGVRTVDRFYINSSISIVATYHQGIVCCGNFKVHTNNKVKDEG